MAPELPTKASQPASQAKSKRKKLQRLPSNAKVHKRPLLHPPIPSPHTNAQKQKVIYVSTHSPFISVVKRTDKLLHLADKRRVQSATTLVQQNRGKRKRTFRPGGGKSGGAGGDDEILAIAEVVEDAKKKGKRGEDGELNGAGGEEVVLKGTGKAIQKVAQLGLWFQQREEYVVKLRTGSVKAVDDVIVDEAGNDRDEVDADAQVGAEAGNDEGGEGAEAMDIDAAGKETSGDRGTNKQLSPHQKGGQQVLPLEEPISKTRIRYTSVLEVAVSLR